ncbi:MAG: hypothetical protein JWO61_378 [Candidatus Saccharibacteria bacterium]|nr:hypothetical protein [Candidatus Saccharibacteria bacterium]
MKQRGFTVIELAVVIAFLIFAGVLFFVQKNNLEVASRDDKRKTAINAMYYGLEESFYKQNGYYPASIDEKNLTTLDSALFTDPNGVKLGQTTQKVDNEDVPVQSEYRYEPTNCADSKCKSYTLRADLEAEADYVKKSRNS